MSLTKKCRERVHAHSLRSYVTELLKMKETFIEPLLHPYSSSSPASPTVQGFDEYAIDSPRESIEHLPIASRFLSPTPFRSDSPSAPTPPLKEEPLTGNIDGESLNSEEEEEAEETALHRGRSTHRVTVVRGRCSLLSDEEKVTITDVLHTFHRPKF